MADNTELDYKWRLANALRHLGKQATGELDARGVDEFRQQLVGPGLSLRSVNMVLDLLAQILGDAVEYGLLDARCCVARAALARADRRERFGQAR